MYGRADVNTNWLRAAVMVVVVLAGRGRLAGVEAAGATHVPFVARHDAACEPM
jgi:hypothetical protein